jgi:hypothetical protein
MTELEINGFAQEPAHAGSSVRPAFGRRKKAPTEADAPPIKRRRPKPIFTLRLAPER